MKINLSFRREAAVLFLSFLIPHVSSGMSAIPLEKVEGEGLTNYYIKCISQDKYGFMWFGTQEGLFRYDGYSFTPVRYAPGAADALPSSHIECLYPDECGRLWVGSRGGLSCLDARTMALRNFPADRSFTVYSLVRLKDSAFIVGTSAGLYTFIVSSGSWRRIMSIPEDVMIRCIGEGLDGRLYIASHRGIYIVDRHNGQTHHLDLPVPSGQQHPLPIAHRVVVDRRGVVWISTWNVGLVRLDPGTEKMTSYLSSSSYDVLEQDDGSLLVANAEKGLTLFDPASHAVTPHPIDWDKQPLQARVYALFRDRAGILWVGTENGIYKRDPHQATLNTISFRAAPGAGIIRPDIEPLCVLRDRQGIWWTGTYEGLYRMDTATGVLTDYSAEIGLPPHTRVTSLVEKEDGGIWATADHRLILLKKNTGGGPIRLHAVIYTSSAISSVVTRIYKDSGQTYWVGTHGNGLFRFDARSGAFTAFVNGDSSKSVRPEIEDIYRLPDGSLISGGEHTGLFRIMPLAGRFERVASFDTLAGRTVSISAIVPGDAGNIWISTVGSGLWKTDAQLRSFTHITTADGLPSMNITTLLCAPGDHVWLVTESGLVDLRPSTGKMKIFNRQSGIRNPYSTFAIHRVDNGTIVLGDMGCIHTINSSDGERNGAPPPVYITGFKVLDKNLPPDGHELPTLSYDQNYFLFEYVALNYTRPELNRYAYMLEGLDKRWNDAGGRRYASYANLPAGVYHFRVKAANNDGVWNELPVQLGFIIRPPFWKTTRFYVLAAIMVLLTGVLLYYFKSEQLKSRERLRNRIARDLHDDIGSTLSSINIFSRIALQKMADRPVESEQLLLRINQRTEKTMESLSDIVWSINTRGDQMTSLVSRMQEFLGELLDASGIQYTFQVDASVRQMHIGMEIRKDIYLIFKEAVHNAFKYSRCTEVAISMKRDDGRKVLLEIGDNGIGFDVHTVSAGNGIRNMQERAARIGADCRIDSVPGRGTLIRLLFAVT